METPTNAIVNLHKHFKAIGRLRHAEQLEARFPCLKEQNAAVKPVKEDVEAKPKEVNHGKVRKR